VFRGQVVASHETWASALPGSLFRRVPGWLAPDRGVVLDLEVARVWKGPLHARRRVLTGLGGGDCGLGASVGDDLLVYAYEEEGSAFTNICTRTGPFAHAGPDLAVLGVGRAPEPGRAYLMLLVPLAFAAFGLGAALVGARHWRQRGSTGSL